MDQQGRPNEPQLVFRRDPQTGRPVEGRLRWGLIPHFCEKRSDFAPIHARAETIAENEWFSAAYRKRRCVVPMNSFFSEGRDREALCDFPSGRPSVRRRRHLRKLARPPDEYMGAHLRRHHRSGERPHRADPVNKHRSWTPWLCEANLLIYVVDSSRATKTKFPSGPTTIRSSASHDQISEMSRGASPPNVCNCEFSR
jgi:hypothetical protein